LDPAPIRDPDEAIVDAAHQHVREVARRIWSLEPTSWADVVARAIIFEFWCNGVDGVTGKLEYLDPERSDEWSAKAHLLDAIRKVGGGHQYSETQ
jgi:hypothetical protein